MSTKILTQNTNFDNQGNKLSQISKNIIVIRGFTTQAGVRGVPQILCFDKFGRKRQCNFALKINAKFIVFCCLIVLTATG